jgi:hypothetical protein
MENIHEISDCHAIPVIPRINAINVRVVWQRPDIRLYNVFLESLSSINIYIRGKLNFYE